MDVGCLELIKLGITKCSQLRTVCVCLIFGPQLTVAKGTFQVRTSTFKTLSQKTRAQIKVN